MGKRDAAGIQQFLKVYVLPLEGDLVCHFCYIAVCSRYCRSSC